MHDVITIGIPLFAIPAGIFYAATRGMEAHPSCYE